MDTCRITLTADDTVNVLRAYGYQIPDDAQILIRVVEVEVDDVRVVIEWLADGTRKVAL